MRIVGKKLFWGVINLRRNKMRQDKGNFVFWRMCVGGWGWRWGEREGAKLSASFTSVVWLNSSLRIQRNHGHTDAKAPIQHLPYEWACHFSPCLLSYCHWLPQNKQGWRTGGSLIQICFIYSEEFMQLQNTSDLYQSWLLTYHSTSCKHASW